MKPMSRISPRLALSFMVACLLLGAILRLPDLSRVPPGLHYDEAANGTLAAEIGLGGKLPLFISSYTGKEVLFFYVAGGLMRLIGQSVFTLRLAAAFTGLLTVAATYWLGWEIFSDRRIALMAAALIAVSFWHLLFSRLGFRAITQPLLQALTLAAFYRGLRRESWSWLAAAGVFLGLAAYTYLAARLLPLLLLPALLPLLWSPPSRNLRGKQLALVVALALIVLAPLLVYFAGNPDAFWVRINQVSPGENAPGLSLGQSYWKSLQMFFLAGDPYWRFNLPQRPLFDWFWGSLMVFGWATLLWRWRRLKADWRRSAALLVLLAPFVMILPTALATREIVPSNLRAIGLIPFVYYLPAAGLVALAQDWERRFQLSTASKAILVISLLALAAGGLVGYRDYFQRWAAEPFVYYESDGDLMAVAGYLDETDTRGTVIYLAALHYRHPTIAFLSEKYEAIKWLPNSEALVFPADSPALIIYPRNSPAPSWAMPYLETADPLPGPAGPDGQPAFVSYRLAAAPSFSIPNPVTVNFGDATEGGAISLLGYQIEATDTERTIPVTLYWKVNGIPPADFTPFLHLQDAWGVRWSQVETFAYPADQWRPGELIIQHVELPVRPGTPPGAYRLRVGLFTPDSGERLPRLDEQGRYSGDTFIIEKVTVSASLTREVPLQPPQEIGALVRPGLRLLGYERGGGTVATGESFPLALWWQATTRQLPLTARLEMMQADNTGHILTSMQPVHGTYPFQRWQTPEFVIDRVDPTIPTSFPPGDYRLLLRLLDDQGATLLSADLGALTVAATERLFKPPKLAHPLAANFGDEINLLGYEFAPGEETGVFTLTLAWQAERNPAADYTVFVHLLDVGGTCCLWQQDAMPRQNQYPTSRWQAKEVVIDRVEMRVPEGLSAGEYAIEVGLYLAETGRRLRVTQPNLEASDVVYLLPLVIR